MTSNLILEQLKKLPSSPGVYIMRDAEGNILYVGKAANLRHRLRSYFGSKQRLTSKLRRMVSRAWDLNFYVTSSEQEALILECTLIKQHHPHYNVRLKDDKTFPYLKISLNEDWPRVYFTRLLEEDGGHYFGPFASAKSVRQTLKVLKGVFPFRSCTKPITGTDRRACLEYHIHHCVAPCIGAVSQEEYAEVIKQVILFLKGKQELIVKELEAKMEKAAQALHFEKATLYRDQIQALERVVEGQKIATKVKGEQDVIAFADDKNQAYVQVFFIRHGKLTGRESFVLQGTRSEEPTQIMAGFIKQYYGASTYVPPLLLLQHPPEDKTVIEDWLRSKRGSKVRIQVPSQGSKKELVEIVAENARQGLEQLKVKEATPTGLEEALEELKGKLNLPQLPLRMEAYDISNIQGKAAVGSMVVFEKGKPKPSHYRRFRIKTVEGVNDYAMLQEILSRRFKRSSLKSPDTLTPDTWAILPDLVLIDGGKGQLNAALSAMRRLGIDFVPTVSLAKENEDIFIPQKTSPMTLPRSSPALQLLQRLRDEAHRFALGYHQRIRKKESFASAFDNVPGIGPKRKRVLFRDFGSVQAIRDASIEELAAVKGMTLSLAKKIKERL